MAQVLVEYFSSSRLACANCIPADVILCVNPEIVVLPTCPTDNTGNPPGTGITDGTGLTSQAGADRPIKGYIEASIVTFIQTRDNCNKPVFRYIFSYDDAQIVLPPNTVFDGDSILGVFCRGCLTEWVTDLVGENVVVEERTAGIITVRNQHGCEFEFRRGWTRLTQAVNGNITVEYPDLTSQTFAIGSQSSLFAPEVVVTESSLATPVLAGADFFSNPATLNITNPSASNTAVAQNSASGSIEFSCPTAVSFAIALQLSIDSGPFVDILVRRSYMPPGTVSNLWEIAAEKTFLRNLIAAQVENVRVRIRLTPTLANIVVESYTVSNVVIGGTL